MNQENKVECMVIYLAVISMNILQLGHAVLTNTLPSTKLDVQIFKLARFEDSELVFEISSCDTVTSLVLPKNFN